MKSKKIIEYLPQYMAEYLEISAIAQTQQNQLDKLSQETDRILINNFVSDCDENSVERYEKILNILPKQNQTIAQRKQIILSKMLNQIPFTLEKLEEILSSTVGKNNFKIDLDCNKYSLILKLNHESYPYMEAINDIFKIVIPANLVYGFLTSIENKANIKIASAISVLQHVKILPLIPKEVKLTAKENVVSTAAYGHSVKIKAKEE